jgi:hypothetical protein
MIEVVDDETFVGLGPGALVETVGRDEQVTVELRVGVSTTAQTGFYSLPIRISHYPISTTRLEETQTIGVAVEGLSPANQAPDADAPRLLIDGVVNNPDPAVAGQPADLTLTVANVGSQPAEQVLVRLTELGPLAPTGGSNVRRVEDISANSTEEVTYTLVTSGSTTAGLQTMSVELTYRDALGVQQTETFTVSLRIATPAKLVFNTFAPLPEAIQVGEEVEFPLEVINVGENAVNISTATVEAEGMTITNGASQYIGPLEGGTAGSIIAAGTAEEPGTASVTVTLNYLDDFSEEQSETFTFELDVEGEPAPDEETTAPAEELTFGQRILRAVAGFFGLGTREPAVVEGN